MSEGAQNLRLFIAVAPPAEVREAAAAVQSRLRGKGDVRWARVDQMHLTLKFLGDTPADRVPEILDVLQKIANKFSLFMIELGEPGGFPNLRKPQTLWLGIDGATELSRLAETLDAELGELGFEREKRGFKPHLTLGRVRSSQGIRPLVEGVEAARAQPGPVVGWPVSELHLFRSELRPAGPEYTVLGTVRLPAKDERTGSALLSR